MLGDASDALNIFCLAESSFITFYLSSFYVGATLEIFSFACQSGSLSLSLLSKQDCWFVMPVGMQTIPDETGKVTGFLLGGIDVLVAYN